MALTQLCIDSTQQYLDFLEVQPGGAAVIISVVDKSKIGDQRWQLTMSARVRNRDSIQLLVAGREVPPEQFEVESYHHQSGRMVLKFHTNNKEFEAAGPDMIGLRSDLRFLIANVQNWFRLHGNEIGLPQSGAGLEPPTVIELRPDHLEAVKSVLTCPLSYVWGPPGTGKTRHVLTAAVLAHIQAGNVVALLAPTNNALDTAMIGLLEATQAHLGTQGQFLRLGTATREFRDRFPDACEDLGIEDALKTVRAERETLKQLKLHREARFNLRAVESVQDDLGTLFKLLEQRRGFDEQRGRFEGERNRLLSRAADQSIQNRIVALGTQIGLINQEAEKVEHTIPELIGQIRDALTGLDTCDMLLKVVSDDDVTPNRALAALEEHEQDLTALVETNSWADELHEDYEDVDQLLTDLDEREKELLRATLPARLQHVQVIGLTFDGYIGRHREKIPPLQQVFVDEAAYVPLIKALTAFRQKVPVAFFGDHFQLRPVCTVPAHAIARLEKTLLWSRSAIFSECAFSPLGNGKRLLDMLSKHDFEPPCYTQTKKTNLIITYRFGPALADLLNDLIYRNGLRSGLAADSLKIDVINVPRSQSGDWTNRAQAIKAVEAFKQDTAQRRSILTPYNNQVSIMKQLLPPSFRDSVMNVNTSQGQEWDTVIFCASDCDREPFLTNSETPQGRTCLNAAISRVRRRLVLVLDQRFWQAPGHSAQLLSRLIA
jgi:hypothetical protein